MVFGHKGVWMFTHQRLGFWTMWEICEEFGKDDHYAGLAKNCSPPSFCVKANDHKGYMLILHPRDEIYAKLVWMARALSQPNFWISSPHFCQIQVEYYQPIAHNEDVIRLYIARDKNRKFCWRVEFEHAPRWINTNSIFIAWKLRKNHSGSLSIPQNYITFAKDNLAHLTGESSQWDLGRSQVVWLWTTPNIQHFCTWSININLTCLKS